MFTKAHPETEYLFDYYSPFKEFIGVLSIPHSGETIPEDMKEFLITDEMTLKSDVDYKVHELVDIKKLQENGIAVIVSKIHRASIDLNRDENNTVLYWKQNTKGETLVTKEPTPAQKEQLKAAYYLPYYEMLKSMIHELVKYQNIASVVDLHSMPSAPTQYHMQQNPKQKTHRPQFCLSDRHGLTCRPEFIKHITDSLTNCQYECTNNDPYIGGYITEYVNKFETNNIQIEINRSLYMDETSKTLVNELVTPLKKNLTQSLIDLFLNFKQK